LQFLEVHEEVAEPKLSEKTQLLPKGNAKSNEENSKYYLNFN